MPSDPKRDPLVLRLEQSPSVADIDAILAPFQATGVVPSLPLVSALLNHTIPETYKSIPSTTQSAILNVMQSLVGLGGLLAKFNTEIPAHFLELYTDFAIDVFNGTLVPQIISNNPTKLELKELDKLIFKGKAFSIIAETLAHSTARAAASVGVFESSQTYTSYVTESILELHRQNFDIRTINNFITSVRSFNPESPVFFDVIFSRQNWPYFAKSIKFMKPFERKELLTLSFCRFLGRWLRLRSNEEVLGAVFQLFEFGYESFDARQVEKILACSNFSLNNVLAMLLSRVQEAELYKIVIELLRNWADETLLKMEPLVKQESRTQLLIHIFAYKKGSLMLGRIMTDPVLLNGVSLRLLALSDGVKGLAIVLSNTLSEMNGSEPIFKEIGYSGEPGHQVQLNIVQGFTELTSSPWDVLELPEIHEPVPLSKELSQLQIEPTKAQFLPYDDSDDDEYDDDDPTVSIRPQVPKPLYIKDLVAFLNVDSKHTNAYEMSKTALKYGPTLIRQKSGFGNELTIYSEELVASIIGLSNQFDDSNFETLRLNILIAVVVAHPDVTLHLFQLLLTGDYSLQTRMIILSAASLSVRELRGYTDQPVSQSYTNKEFATKQLPASVHNRFLLPLAETAAIASVQNGLMSKPSEEAQASINGGNVLRVSRALRPRLPGLESKPKVKLFYNIVSLRFFYPLIRIWYETGEIDIGTYTPVFVGHFLSTLNLVLHSAYPSAANLHDMVGEYIILLNPLIVRVQQDQLPVIESLVTGVMLICDIMDGQFLLSTHGSFIQLVQTWLQQIWESVIDDRIKSLCAGLLLRLAGLAESYERTLMDQLNSVY